MGVVQRFERRIEALVNGVFARAFKAQVEPVEVAAALQRECDDKSQILDRERRISPNIFVVELGPADHARLSPYEGPLCDEFAAMIREHAGEQRYVFPGQVTVTLELVETLDTGVFRIRSTAAAVTAPAAPAPPAPPAAPPRPAPRKTPPPIAPPPLPPPEVRGSGPYLDVDGARALLVGARTTIGRGPDCDVSIEDPGVSRRHAEIHLTDGRATLVDLGSTNGTLVGGRRVSSVPLTDGTQVQFGSTIVVFRTGRADRG